MKKNLFLLLSVFFLCSAAVSEAQVISTYAGTGGNGYSGDGGAASAAQLANPTGVTVDRQGNVYIADANNFVIRKVNHVTGIITTVAGNDTMGYSGDGGPATSAKIGVVGSLTVDTAGNIYFTDQSFFVVRKVNTAGIISTFAGNGTEGFSGDLGPATDAQLDGPTGIAADNAGNVYIADFNNNEVRKVNAAGTISAFAGIGGLVGGYSGDGLPATAALLYGPANLKLDTLGNLFISEGINQDVRKVNTLGIISTVAGNSGMGAGYTGDGGLATAAQLNSPAGVALDLYGNVYIADQNNSVIRKVNTAGIITTFAGTGTPGYSGDGGAAATAQISYPGGIAIDRKNNFFIADMSNNAIRLITSESAPEFVRGDSQNFVVCMNAGNRGIDSLLAIVDSNIGQTETLTLITAPPHGVVANLPATLIATGDTIQTSGVTYRPNTGFSGADSFTVQVSDGILTAQTTVHVTVNPLPVLTVPSDQTFCNQQVTPVLTNSSSVSGSTITWSNNNTSIGLAASGTGNVPSFTATNTTSSAVVATITVHVSANGCGGASNSFTITVNPTPAVDPQVNRSVCNGGTLPAINFSGTGTSYTWTNNNTTIGLGGSGIGDVPAFTAINNGTTPVVAIIAVTAAANGCTGAPDSFNITVNPTPNENIPNSMRVCSGSATGTETFTSTVAGTSFSWTNSNTAIGLGASGTGNIPSFIAANTTTDTISGEIVVTPSRAGCIGSPDSFMLTVAPAPVLTTTLTPPGICSGSTFYYVPASATPGTAFSWSRAAISGIAGGSASGTDTINEVLTNTSASNINVTYVDTLKAYGCTNTQHIVVNVASVATLSSAVTDTICDSAVFNYIATSATAGATFTWVRDSVAGISNPADSATTDTISEMLVNTTHFPVTTYYMFTINNGSCADTQRIAVTVDPVLQLSNPVTTTSVCDSALFSYSPTDTVTGLTYTWTRAFVTGISNPPDSGTFAINEILYNVTNSDRPVTYVYTISANGCSATQDVMVTVRPTPKLTVLNAYACSNQPFTFVPAALPASSTFAWTRLSATNVTGSAVSSGTGNIHDTLTDLLNIPQNIVYADTLNYQGCKFVQDVTVEVYPAIPAAVIATQAPSSVCMNTMYQNFGAATAPDSNVTYSWTATNATVWSTGINGQYALVNFDAAGTATVTLNAGYTGAVGCLTPTTVTVSVSSNASETPVVSYFDNHFVCTPANEGAYQWGYDDKATLDSTLLSGEINQDYLNASPDLANKYYWVMTTASSGNGCMQKTYYNTPLTVQNVNDETAGIKAYPNPASSQINVEITSSARGNIQLDVINMLGQKMSTVAATDNKAVIDVTQLSAGTYVIACYRDGVKVATTRFIKN